MEYYLLRQSGKVVNPVRLTDLDQRTYTARMTHDEFRSLENLKNAYIEYDRTWELPDLLIYPTYMVSDNIRKVFHMYDDSISFKGIQLFPTQPKWIKEASPVYWVYDCVTIDCLHADTIVQPNGAVKELILDGRKLTGADIFKVRGTMENKTVVSLAVAESILRRNPYGVVFEKCEKYF